MIVVFKYVKSYHKEGGEQLFSSDTNEVHKVVSIYCLKAYLDYTLGGKNKTVVTIKNRRILEQAAWESCGIAFIGGFKEEAG